MGQRDAVLREAGAGAIRVARAQPGDGRARVALKRRDMLRRAPADAADGHTPSFRSAGSMPFQSSRAYTCARTFSRNRRLSRACAIVSTAVAPTLQHSTMIGPANPAVFSVPKTAAKST